MKTYFPYYVKKIGIIAVVIAIILSLIANINDMVTGFMAGFKSATAPSSGEIDALIEYKIISETLAKTLTWISLTFSFGGFILYIFSREKAEDEFIQKVRYMSLAKSLLITWFIVFILILINGDIKLEGLYILQFQLFIYVVIYNYYSKWKYR